MNWGEEGDEPPKYETQENLDSGYWSGKCSLIRSQADIIMHEKSLVYHPTIPRSPDVFRYAFQTTRSFEMPLSIRPYNAGKEAEGCHCKSHPPDFQPHLATLLKPLTFSSTKSLY
jgi:hypothetical protein